jgi:hypothetical protein
MDEKTHNPPFHGQIIHNPFAVQMIYAGKTGEVMYAS